MSEYGQIPSNLTHLLPLQTFEGNDVEAQIYLPYDQKIVRGKLYVNVAGNVVFRQHQMRVDVKA